MRSKAEFLKELEHQAKLQSRLSTSSVIPSQFAGVTAFIGNYPWQTLLVLSGISAGVLFWMKGG